MPANLSESKVRVTNLFGGSEVVGGMDPAVDMRVKHGNEFFWVKALASGNFTVDLALASGGAVVRQAYPMDLYVETPVASGFGWPTGGGSYVWGSDWTTGVPVRDTSKMTFIQAGAPYSFTR